MNLRNILIILKKEFKISVRDKSIILSNFLIPLFSMPLVVLLILFVKATKVSTQEVLDYKVGIVSFEKEYQIPEFKKEKIFYHKVSSIDTKTIDLKSFRELKYDLVLIQSDKKHHSQIEFIYDSTINRSEYLAAEYKRILRKKSKVILKDRLKERGIASEFLTPIVLKDVKIVPLTQFAGVKIGAQLGVYLLVLFILGMYYPAINAFVGEKENKTMQHLLLSSSNDNDIVLAKMVNILFFGILSFIPYIVHYLIFDYFLGDKLNFFKVNYNSFFELSLIILNFMAIGFVVASICIIVSMLANSISRAQALLSGFMVISIVPISVLTVLDLKYSGGMAAFPFLNFFLMVKQVLVESTSIVPILTTLIINSCLGVSLMFGAFKIFKNKNVLV
ncbi:MAG: ABC-type Na+ efflux pump permease subunit [Thermoproteota archaeon]|jgi:ABC-type Na+ efflux pump permease subunit